MANKQETKVFSSFVHEGKVYSVSWSDRAYESHTHTGRPSDWGRRFRLFVDHDTTVMEDFASRMSGERYSREVKKLERVLAKEALKVLGLTQKKLRYSIKCGCKQCPCSPGFFVNSVNTFDGGEQNDYYGVIWVSPALKKNK